MNSDLKDNKSPDERLREVLSGDIKVIGVTITTQRAQHRDDSALSPSEKLIKMVAIDTMREPEKFGVRRDDGLGFWNKVESGLTQASFAEKPQPQYKRPKPSSMQMRPSLSKPFN